MNRTVQEKSHTYL